jgi:hypothetical protein
VLAPTTAQSAPSRPKTPPEITVLRTFADFDDFWATSLMSGNIGPIVATISAGDAELKTRVHARLPADEAGHITYAGRANAIKGCVPK